jgi:hypothetical protein
MPIKYPESQLSDISQIIEIRFLNISDVDIK